jgi:hypothetical protein
MAMLTYPMVLVHWIDAAMSSNEHWQDGDRPSPPTGKGLHECYTVGFVTHSDGEWLQLVTTFTDGAHAHVTEIPASMIKTVTVLETTASTPQAKKRAAPRK